jgi:hypothetical protein
MPASVGTGELTGVDRGPAIDEEGSPTVKVVGETDVALLPGNDCVQKPTKLATWEYMEGTSETN